MQRHFNTKGPRMLSSTYEQRLNVSMLSCRIEIVLNFWTKLAQLLRHSEYARIDFCGLFRSLMFFVLCAFRLLRVGRARVCVLGLLESWTQSVSWSSALCAVGVCDV